MNGTADVDEYLAGLPGDARAALEAVRATIRGAVPEATEGISYRIPTFKVRGRPLVGFGAATRHCALYVMSVEVVQAHASELERYPTGKGSVRFPPDEPLPASLVRKLVRARLEELEPGGRRPG